MLRYFLVILLSFNILSSNENIVKTSELELFLFKIGFESLLKDVELNKDKSSLNSKEIKNINEKIELIMSELYKNKRVLFNDSNEVKSIQTVDNKELEGLKSEIAFLKDEITKLKKSTSVNNIEKKNIVSLKPKLKEKVLPKSNVSAVVVVDASRVREKPLIESKVLREIPISTNILLDSCDRFGWCKIKGKKEYIARQLLKLE